MRGGVRVYALKWQRKFPKRNDSCWLQGRPGGNKASFLAQFRSRQAQIPSSAGILGEGSLPQGALETFLPFSYISHLLVGGQNSCHVHSPDVQGIRRWAGRAVPGWTTKLSLILWVHISSFKSCLLIPRQRQKIISPPKSRHLETRLFKEPWVVIYYEDGKEPAWVPLLCLWHRLLAPLAVLFSPHSSSCHF